MSTHPRQGAIKVQLGEPVSFIGVIYRNMGEGLLKGAEMSQRQVRHQSLPQRGVADHITQ